MVMSKLDVRVDIERWFTGGGDFESGVELLDCMMNNPYYVSVIRRKGAKRGMEQLRAELRRFVSPGVLRQVEVVNDAIVAVPDSGIAEKKNE